mmetsp:Transcript_14543/g.37706  ORF Transcript_14543/g.37706 Transcript_14543/m.37706 type:complete len:482 (+) Transcript_14543:3-1448(+)
MMWLPSVSAAAVRMGVQRATAGAHASRWLARSTTASRRPIRLATTEAVGADQAPPINADKPLASSFLRQMQTRGYLYQCSNIEALDELMSTTSIPVYLGFDATASSLHVGSLLQIMILRKLQQCGHKPVVLVGGGTTKVGDPSGRDSTRQMLTDEQIDENIRGITQVFEKFITFGDGPTDAILVNNDEWLNSLRYLPLLRDYGRHFTINRMLSFESVKQRLEREQPLTFLEFNYMILQAYDFVELWRRHGCRLQLGGSDQWGNIINGVELGRRVEDAELFGLTAPLLTTADGKKMGKSMGGAVWLNADLLSPYDYWQYWRNTADADVVRFLKLFTELSDERIDELAQLKGQAINEAKVVLADETTRMLHGGEVLDSIKETASQLFAQKSGGGGGGSLDDLPSVGISSSEVDEGVPVVDLFMKLEFAKSKSEVRRLIEGGGARLNDEKIEDAALVVTAEQFADGQVKVSSGKKKHGLVKIEG